MAEIRSFPHMKEEAENKKNDYRQKLFQHKIAGFYRVGLVLAAFLAIFFIVRFQYGRHIYTGYDVVSTLERDTVSEAVDIRLQDSILTYSKDGAHCTDAKGNILWNETYEIQDILIAVNKNVIAIAGYNSRDIYISSTEKILGTVNTEMPIKDIAVSAEGVVTAVLADTNVTWINTYSPSGKKLYYSSTTMGNSGYPGAIALSANGELLVVAYVYVDTGEIKTNIAFYNFGAVGDNKQDQIVGVYTQADQIIPDIRFLDDETVATIGDSQIRIYKGRQTPMETAVHMLNGQKIRSVFSGAGYLGLVFYSDDINYKYRIDIYGTSAEKVGSYYFDLDYTDILFEKNDFVIYNESGCVIKTYSGMEKYNGIFEQTVNIMVPANGAYRYILVNDNSINTIQLK